MLAGVHGSESYLKWYSYIEHEQTKEAFSYFVGLAATQPSYTFQPGAHGKVEDFRFYDKGNQQPFAFTVAKGWLRFYFRPPAVRSDRYSFSEIKSAFDEAEQHTEDEEWTVPLRSIADVKRLWSILALS